MTEHTVAISITIKVNEQQIEYKRDIAAKELEKSIRQIAQEFGGRILTTSIGELDEELRTSVPKSWQNVGTEKRSVVSSVGWIQYQRRIYRDETGKRRKPVDEVLGLQPYARMSEQVEEMGAYLASESTYREAADRLGWMLKTEFSHSTIQRMVWKVGNQMADQAKSERERIFTGGGAEQKGKIKAKVLYGESDGVWLHLQQEARKTIEVRVGTMYTGKVPIGYKRNALENKCSVVAVGMNSRAWQEELLRVGHQKYDLEHVQLLVAGGDGNVWVKNSFARFELQQEYILDRFHLSRAARRAIGNRTTARETVKQIRKEGWKAVKGKLLQMIYNAQGKRKQKLQEFYRYLSNNQHGLLDLEHRGYSCKLGTLGTIEGNVDKLVVRRMKGRGRSWKRQGLRAMLALCQHKKELRDLAFQYQPVTAPQKSYRRRMKLSVDYNECFQGRMPIFTGPDRGKPWVESLYRCIHRC